MTIKFSFDPSRKLENALFNHPRVQHLELLHRMRNSEDHIRFKVDGFAVSSLWIGVDMPHFATAPWYYDVEIDMAEIFRRTHGRLPDTHEMLALTLADLMDMAGRMRYSRMCESLGIAEEEYSVEEMSRMWQQVNEE
jgi:hypothetical protein